MMEENNTQRIIRQFHTPIDDRVRDILNTLDTNPDVTMRDAMVWELCPILILATPASDVYTFAQATIELLHDELSVPARQELTRIGKGFLAVYAPPHLENPTDFERLDRAIWRNLADVLDESTDILSNG